jgi:hypothetical protein
VERTAEKKWVRESLNALVADATTSVRQGYDKRHIFDAERQISRLQGTCESPLKASR